MLRMEELENGKFVPGLEPQYYPRTVDDLEKRAGLSALNSSRERVS